MRVTLNVVLSGDLQLESCTQQAGRVMRFKDVEGEALLRGGQHKRKNRLVVDDSLMLHAVTALVAGLILDAEKEAQGGKAARGRNA
jgi:hypothetical protein